MAGRDRTTTSSTLDVHNTFLEVRRKDTALRRERNETAPGILEHDEMGDLEDEDPLILPGGGLTHFGLDPGILGGSQTSPSYNSEPMSVVMPSSRVDLPDDAVRHRARLSSSASQVGGGGGGGRTRGRTRTSSAMSVGSGGPGHMTVPATPEAFNMPPPYAMQGNPFLMPQVQAAAAAAAAGTYGTNPAMMPPPMNPEAAGMLLLMAQQQQHLAAHLAASARFPPRADARGDGADQQISLSQLLPMNMPNGPYPPFGPAPGQHQGQNYGKPGKGGGGKGATTLMLRNIPNNYQRDGLLEEIDSRGFKGCYDFFYLPIDFRNLSNMGYAFINMISPQEAQRFKMSYQGTQLTAFRSAKVCEVCDARVQGRWRNVEQYRNSAVMNMDEEYQPIILENGIRAPFPRPTAMVKPLKLRPPRASPDAPQQSEQQSEQS